VSCMLLCTSYFELIMLSTWVYGLFATRETY
jgi:hypothetical protein